MRLHSHYQINPVKSATHYQEFPDLYQEFPDLLDRRVCRMDDRPLCGARYLVERDLCRRLVFRDDLLQVLAESRSRIGVLESIGYGRLKVA